MTRRERERAILEIVVAAEIRTQGELVEALATRGFVATQATVSRDVKRLGLIKLPGHDGIYHYAPPTALSGVPTVSGDALRRVFREAVTGHVEAEALVVIRTLPGHANAVAVALDEARLPELAGTIAGDDTVLLLVRRKADRRRLEEVLSKLYLS